MHSSVQLEDTNLLRWGGVAGLAGGALMLFVFVFVGAVVGPDPAGLEGPVSRFPEISAARTLENALYLGVTALWMVNIVVLARVLRGGSLAPSLVGGALGIAGLTLLAAGALPHVATTRLADLYHASGATSQDQATVVLLWQANQGMFDALLAAGLVLLSIGVTALGFAMRRAPAFGTRFSALTVVFGLTGIAAASAVVIDPRSSMAVVGFLALIAFSIVLGWKSIRLSIGADTASATLVDRTATVGSHS